MKPYCKVHKSGAWVTMDKQGAAGMYEVKVYTAAGMLRDKVRCDDYRDALEYRRAFNAIARNG